MILVCDIVEYGMDSFGKNPQTWRVTHHLKRVEDHVRKPRKKKRETVEDICRRLGYEFREEERQRRKKAGLPHKRRYRLLYCKPEEATHVSLTSISGCHAPISECKYIRQVDWTPEHIVETQKDAVGDFWLGNLKNFHIDWDWE